MEKPNSVIVYGYNKYFIGAVDSTDRIKFSNQQLYSTKTRLVVMYVETHYNIASKTAFPIIGVPDR